MTKTKIQMMDEISDRINILFDAKYRNHDKEADEIAGVIESMYKGNFMINIQINRGVSYEQAFEIREKLYERRVRAIKKKYYKRNQRLSLKIKRLVNQRGDIVFS